MRPAAANFLPLIDASCVPPIENSPPWIHTITGRGLDALAPVGCQIETVKQSSLIFASPSNASCGHDGGFEIVPLTGSLQGFTSIAGRKRSSLIGGTAKGTPLNEVTLPLELPMMGPSGVSTVTIVEA
jgi:hypothetical protein